MADVLDKLTEGGAAAVGIDVLFDTPSEKSIEDKRLAEAIEKYGVTVLSVAAPSSASIRNKRTIEGIFQADNLIMAYRYVFFARRTSGASEQDSRKRRYNEKSAVIL